MIIRLSFFFEGYGDHRDLHVLTHAFPTRRSSDLIVGVNKYRRQDEDLLETLEVDNAKVREGQIARINRVKASRDQAACDAALKALRDGDRKSTRLNSSH